jgi:hypothetical protein
MNSEPETTEPANSAEEPNKMPESSPPDEEEFKIIVRKLDIPVRPRGVLAE